MKSLLCMSQSPVLPQLPVLEMEGALEEKRFPSGQKVQSAVCGKPCSPMGFLAGMTPVL